VIGYSETIAHADSANDVRLMIKLDSTEGRKVFGGHMLDDITLDY
jgi:twitching motility protein PilU